MSKLLDIQNLSISFQGVKAVQDVSFSIEKGEILGLIGPNGSGKTTIVNLISGVYTPKSGKIIMDGHEFTHRHSIEHRSRLGIGRTFQSPRPFANLTVRGNIFAIALIKHSHKKATEKTDEILRITKLDVLADMPASKLPIEKRKWLDLARVLATDPKLIMLDEVMAGLNPIEMEESLELVRQINQAGTTILFIEHVMWAVVSICTRTIVLNEGKILFEGEPREALNNNQVIEAYIGGGHQHALDH